MSIFLSLGIGALLPKRLPDPFCRTDVLFAIAERAQALSFVDIELCDWLEAAEERSWPGPDDATWYKVQMPDIMGPVSAPAPNTIREKWATIRAREGVSVNYPNGAICVPWVQRAGRLTNFGQLDFLDGLWCMPLGVLEELAELDESGVNELINDCAQARVPISIATRELA